MRKDLEKEDDSNEESKGPNGLEKIQDQNLECPICNNEYDLVAKKRGRYPRLVLSTSSALSCAFMMVKSIL